MSPLNRTVTRMMASRVISAMTGALTKLSRAAGARLNPMRATIAPDTTGGITRSIHPAPARCTTSPTTASSAPTTMIPDRASGMPPIFVAAPIGARNANDEPR